MKRNFKRVSRRTLSIILAILIVMSTMLIGTLSVSAASTGSFNKGDIIYFDFRDAVNNPTNNDGKNGANIYMNDGNTEHVDSCDPAWDNANNRYISNVQDYVAVTLSSAIDFSQYDGKLCKAGGYGWVEIKNDKTKLPTASQNMIVLKQEKDSNNSTIYFYEWGTYGSSSGGDTNQYYYKGTDSTVNSTRWEKTAMTVSADGFYEYVACNSENCQDVGTNQFLIGTKDDENAYKASKVKAGFNNTDIGSKYFTETGEVDIKCTYAGEYYVLVYYPNTTINSGSDPVICASTTLPNGGSKPIEGKVTLKAYQSDGTTELTTAVEAGTSIVLKATSNVSIVTYDLYKGDAKVDTNSTGVFTVTPDSKGTFVYTVKAVDSANKTITSNNVSVTVTKEEVAVLKSVSLSAPASAILGSKITLTATPVVEGTANGISYTYYLSNDNVIGNDTEIKTTTATTCIANTPETEGTYYYYVTATLNGTTVTSAIVPVIVEKPQGEHQITIYFKAPSAAAYKPTATLDGTAYTMTRESTCLGSIYSGAVKIYWYSVTVTVDSSKSHTLKFTTSGTDLNASITDKFNGDVAYLAVDNLMNGTEVVNLTAQPEYIRNYYHTPTHMVYSDDYSDGNLGFTYVEGAKHRMGSYITNGLETFTIDSVTAIQKMSADCMEASELQTCLFDCNLDGEVDINDATLMQKALAQ